jgi:quercetin dioxygenase-like cupin family protein
MPFLNTNSLPVIERLPGWHGRYFHSQNMTFAHYDFTRGSSIHEHFHPEEEVYEVIEGELEVTIDGVARITRAGLVAIVPANVRHWVKALTDGKVIIVVPLQSARDPGLLVSTYLRCLRPPSRRLAVAADPYPASTGTMPVPFWESVTKSNTFSILQEFCVFFHNLTT